MRLKGGIKNTTGKICYSAHCVVASAVTFTGMHVVPWNAEERIILQDD